MPPHFPPHFPNQRHHGKLFAVWALVALSLLSFTAPAHAQNQIWLRQFGSTRDDNALALAADGVGGMFVGGETRGDLAAPRTFGIDAFLARYDATGNQLWIRQLSSPGGNDAILGIATDGVGGAMVAGSTNGSLGGPGAGSTDAFLARYDSVGNQLWIRQFGTSGPDRASDVSPDGAGGTFVLGRMWDPSVAESEPFLARYDAAGDQLWIRRLGGEDEFVTALAPDGAGGVIVFGYNIRGEGTFLIRYDSSGNQLWVRQLGFPANVEVGGLATDGAGGVMIVGETWGSFGGPSAGRSDAWIAHYDATGEQLWLRQFGTIDEERAEAITPDGRGGAVIAGLTNGSLGGREAGGGDAWIARYDATGEQLWLRQFGTGVTDWATSLAPDGVGGVMVAGYTEGSLGGPNAGDDDVFLARYGNNANCDYADCDKSTGTGVLDIFDFLCFQDAFVAICPSHRASDWWPGWASGTVFGNPSPDQQGRLVWSYEWTTGGPLGSGNPWYANTTRRSRWDRDWFGTGQGAWSQDDDVNPPIFRNRMTHNIAAASWTDIPIVRWLNPAGDNAEVSLAGSLTIKWSGDGGMGSPVDVDVVIAKSDASQGTWEVLFSATVSKPIPQPTIGDEVILPINLEGIALNEGDSIVISHRAVSDSGSIGRWIVLLDDVTLTGPVFGCYADCDGSGTLDIFDFLCFQNAFVGGCP